MQFYGTVGERAHGPRFAKGAKQRHTPPRPAVAKARSLAALAAFALAVMCLQLGAHPIGAQSIDEQTAAIAKQLKCPVCQNIPVAYSQSQLAEEMREVIRDKVAQGESEEAIIQYFVDRYGEDVLLEPRREGFSLLLWVSSIGILLFGAAVVAVVLWNWNQSRPAATSPASAATDSPTPTAGKLEEIFEEEFARYKQGKRS